MAMKQKKNAKSQNTKTYCKEQYAPTQTACNKRHENTLRQRRNANTHWNVQETLKHIAGHTKHENILQGIRNMKTQCNVESTRIQIALTKQCETPLQ